MEFIPPPLLISIQRTAITFPMAFVLDAFLHTFIFLKYSISCLRAFLTKAGFNAAPVTSSRACCHSYSSSGGIGVSIAARRLETGVPVLSSGDRWVPVGILRP